MKIVVIGNSVVLDVYPPREKKEDGVFSEHLERLLKNTDLRDIQVINSGEHGTTIIQGLKRIDANIIRYFPDYVIINYGIVECPPRAYPSWLINSVKVESPWRPINAVKIVCRGIIKLTRTSFIKLFRGGPWVPKDVFQRALIQLIESIDHHTKAKIVLLNIPPSLESREKQLPGLFKRIDEYNKIISEIAKEKKLLLIDCYSLVKKQSPEKLMPEGFHLNAQGHRLLAEEIIQKVWPEK